MKTINQVTHKCDICRDFTPHRFEYDLHGVKYFCLVCEKKKGQ